MSIFTFDKQPFSTSIERQKSSLESDPHRRKSILIGEVGDPLFLCYLLTSFNIQLINVMLIRFWDQFFHNEVGDVYI